MRTQLTIACLAAISQAVKIDAAQCCNHSTSSNSKCNPCDPSWERFEPDTDHKKKDEIDITKDFLEDFQAVGDEFIHESKIDAILEAEVGLEVAEDIESHILKPIVDAAVGELIPVKKIAEVIASMNMEDEKIEITDDLPPVEVVVEKEIEEAAEKDEGVTFHTTVVSDPKDFDKATVEELDTPNGEIVVITIPHNVDGTTIEEVATGEIEDLAEEMADEMVDDLAEEAAPEVESESEEEEPEFKPVCGPHIIDGEEFDLRDIATTAEDGYWSRVIDLDGLPAEGWLNWNYCADIGEEGRYARYYSSYYPDTTIANHNVLVNGSFNPGDGLQFEMETTT